MTIILWQQTPDVLFNSNNIYERSHRWNNKMNIYRRHTSERRRHWLLRIASAAVTTAVFDECFFPPFVTYLPTQWSFATTVNRASLWTHHYNLLTGWQLFTNSVCVQRAKDTALAQVRFMVRRIYYAIVTCNIKL